VNTLIVNNAHQFGLSQLYQLRGRVGRSSRQAYCYLIVPPYSALTSDARIRLQKLIEFSRLGSGFRIAAMDMEIRGSGDILGKAQSGHIAEVGFDLYCKMLEETVAEMKGEKPHPEKKEVTVKLQAEIMIPETYIPDTNQRLALYRRVSTITSIRQLEELNDEIRDRYGKPPKNFDYLLAYGRIKLLAEDLGISQIAREGKKLIFKFDKDKRPS
jgi:transcription-repair coupling factor (superfamily II helicase)